MYWAIPRGVVSVRLWSESATHESRGPEGRGISRTLGCIVGPVTFLMGPAIPYIIYIYISSSFFIKKIVEVRKKTNKQTSSFHSVVPPKMALSPSSLQSLLCPVSSEFDGRVSLSLPSQFLATSLPSVPVGLRVRCL